MKFVTLSDSDLKEVVFYPTLDEALTDAGVDELDSDDEIGILVAYDVKTSKHFYAVETTQDLEHFTYVKSGELSIENLLDLWKGYVITADDKLKQEPVIW